MIGFIFATSIEAGPFLEKTGPEQIERKPFPLFNISVPGSKKSSILIISGIGKIAAALAAQVLILKYNAELIVNAGVCGGVRKNIETGMIFRINEALEGDSEIFGKCPEPILCTGNLLQTLPPAILITSDKPVFEPDKKKEIAKRGDLVDMEGAAVARTCEMYDTPCSLIKGVTDPADSKTVLHKNLNKVSRNIAGALIGSIF
jgi:nucleoside phosphorylase